MRLALILLFVIGLRMIVCNASSNAILQTILPGGLRGRVLALYTAADLGGATVGDLLAGWVASIARPAPTMLGAGILLLLAAARFRIRLEHPRVHWRPLYAAQGIPPRTAS